MDLETLIRIVKFLFNAENFNQKAAVGGRRDLKLISEIQQKNEKTWRSDFSLTSKNHQKKNLKTWKKISSNFIFTFIQSLRFSTKHFLFHFIFQLSLPPTVLKLNISITIFYIFYIFCIFFYFLTRKQDEDINLTMTSKLYIHFSFVYSYKKCKKSLNLKFLYFGKKDTKSNSKI